MEGRSIFPALVRWSVHDGGFLLFFEPKKRRRVSFGNVLNGSKWRINGGYWVTITTYPSPGMIFSKLLFSLFPSPGMIFFQVLCIDL